ncbi:MAG: DNA translocase FtsK [Candidatus Promineifilaceae bacterium]
MTRKKTTGQTTKRKTEARRKTTRGGTSSRKSSGSGSTSKRRTTKKRTTTRSKKQAFSLNMAQKVLISGMGIIFVTAILVLSLLSPNQGELTAGLSALMWRTFGWGGLVMPLITGGIGLYMVLWGMDQAPELPLYRLFGFTLFFLAFESFASLIVLMVDNGYNDVWTIARSQTGGGYLGGLLTYTLVQSVGTLGAIFTLGVLSMVAVVFMSGITRAQFAQFLRDVRDGRYTPAYNTPQTEIPINPGQQTARTLSRRTDTPTQLPLQLDETPQPEPKKEKETPQPKERPIPTAIRGGTRRKEKNPPPPEPEPTVVTPVIMGNMSRRRGNAPSWKLPEIAEILEPGSEQNNSNATIREQVEIIEHTLESFGAPATVVEINQGPTITQYGVEPAFIQMRNGRRTKVKVGKIASLADDLALALAAHSIRIQAPVPGKGYVGIEVPNTSKALVSLRDVMESPQFQKIKSPLRIGLGQNVAGTPISADLTAMPHLLIAGTTGSGKSVCVNTIICSLLLQNTPEELKLVMVDPKRVELTGYNGIPHLAAPVVVEMDKVIGTLQWALREMDNRYKMFADMGARNITDYNKKIKRHKDIDPLPYIVIVIDELADLMMLAPEDTERAITRLAQMARATGIHMVIATQRPSVDVVTGLIKANFPARIAFAVASSTDSRVVLDTTGAERLLGQGDMLFQSPDAAAPVRLQGCFVSDGEISKLIAYWQRARRFNVISAEESVVTRNEETAVPPPHINTPKPTPTPPVQETAVPAHQNNNTEALTQPIKITSGQPPTLDDDTIPFDAAPQEQPTQFIAPKPQQAPDTPRPGESAMQQPLWEALQAIEENSDEPELEDDLLPEAITLVRTLQKASTSLLQRRFRIGYTRAARIIDYMEEMGIIGPPTGTSKARKVLLPPPGEEIKPDINAETE